MKKYIGTKIIEAQPGTMAEAQAMKSQYPVELQKDPSGPQGYIVKYPDGYISWSPKEPFEAAYRESGNMTFGLAIEALKKGLRVARHGWNGKEMYLYHVPANRYTALTDAAKGIAGADGKVEYGAYVAIKTAKGNVEPWLATQADILGEDWYIVE